MSSPIQSLRFDAPAGWTDLSMLSYVGPGDDRFRANIMASHEEHAGPLDAYVDALVAGFARELEKHELLKREATQVAGAKAETVDHMFVEEGVPVRQLQLFVAKGGVVYAIGVTFARAQSAEAEAAFAQVKKSLKLG